MGLSNSFVSGSESYSNAFDFFLNIFLLEYCYFILVFIRNKNDVQVQIHNYRVCFLEIRENASKLPERRMLKMQELLSDERASYRAIIR